MEITQQPPKMLSLDEIASKTFGENQEKEPTTLEAVSSTPEAVSMPSIEDLTKTPTEVIPTTNTVENPTESSTIYSSKIRGLIEDGFLEDFLITLDDKEVFLSEIDIQDKDTYQSILENIKEERERVRSEKYISKDGLDETTQKLIEIRKAGGDINDILKENVQAIDQLQELKDVLESYEVEDSEKEQVAISIVAQDLYSRGLSQKVVQAQIEDYIESGVLDETANSILDNHLDLHSKAIDQRRQLEVERLEKEKEDFKNFKKSLSSTYKSFNVPENIQKVLVENATKLDDLKISNTDKLYFEAQSKNPELYAKVNFLLNNPQEFEKWISGKRVTEAKKEIIRSSIIVNTNKKKEYKAGGVSTLEDIAANTFNK